MSLIKLCATRRDDTITIKKNNHLWMCIQWKELWSGGNIRVGLGYPRLCIFPENMGTRKIKHFYEQLVVTLHSLPGRWPCALLLHIRLSTRWDQTLSLLEQNSTVSPEGESDTSGNSSQAKRTVWERDSVMYKYLWLVQYVFWRC
jgi:hypothetical protein